MFAFLEKEFLGMKYVNCKGKEIVPRWGFHFKFSLHSIIIFFQSSKMPANTVGFFIAQSAEEVKR